MTNYDEVAAHYDTRYRGHAYPGLARTLRELARDVRGLRALEVGAGTGHWLALLGEDGVEAVGLEPSREMIQRAQAQGNTRLVRGTATALPFAAQSLDLVYCVNAFHHFPEPRRFLAEAKRCLAPQGVLAVIGMDPHAGVDRWSIYDYFEGTRELDLARFVAANELRTWLADAGFASSHTELAEHLDKRFDAEQALRDGKLDRRFTSQLSELSDAAYRAGIARIQGDLAREKTLTLHIDVRLYATIARA